MNKYLYSLVLCGLSFQTIAFNEEVNLLAAWGVSQNLNGDIIYQGSQFKPRNYWVSQPMPHPQSIDYSTLPIEFKPLIIYQQR